MAGRERQNAYHLPNYVLHLFGELANEVKMLCFSPIAAVSVKIAMRHKRWKTRDI
jgi:hypothetical protein